MCFGHIYIYLGVQSTRGGLPPCCSAWILFQLSRLSNLQGGMQLGVVKVPTFDDIYGWLKGAITGDHGGKRDSFGLCTGGWALDRSVVVKFGESEKFYYKAGDLDEMGFPQYDLWKVPGGLYDNPDEFTLGPDGRPWTKKTRAEKKKSQLRRVRRLVPRVVKKALLKVDPPAG